MAIIVWILFDLCQKVFVSLDRYIVVQSLKISCVTYFCRIIAANFLKDIYYFLNFYVVKSFVPILVGIKKYTC